MKSRIVYKKSYRVERCWCLNGFYDAIITGCIYLIEPWLGKPYLSIRVFTPYLSSPNYDGEYGTNRYLASKEVEVRAELEIQKDRLSRRMYRYFKRTRYERRK